VRSNPTTTLAVLTAINLLNYLDRNVLSAVLPSVKGDFVLTDGQGGLLGSMFLVTYLLASPLSGHLGDRWPRKYIVAGGVLVWSLATMGGGIARSYEGLLATRALIGVGEAGYVIVAPGMIADLYRRERRGRMLSIFYVAMPVGIALGYLVGGFVGERFGWRSAFFVAGGPGVLLALLALLVREPERGATDDAAAAAPELRARDAWARLARTPVWRYNTIGSIFMLFALGAGAFWMPTFLVRHHGMSLEQAGTSFGLVSVVAGILGTMVGGVAGDRVFRRHEGGHLQVSGLALLAAAPVLAAMPYMPTSGGTLAMSFLACGLLGVTVGPLNAALVGCIPATLRSVAVAANLICAHLLGDAASPYLVGHVSDEIGLQASMSILATPVALGGAVLLLGARRVRRLPGGLMAYPG
jgi:MFS family permease